MDIFEILSKDERLIAYSSEEDRILITWNQSLTLQWWTPVVKDGRIPDPNDWEEVSVRTLSDEPKSYRAAREAAIRWYTGD